MTRLTRPCTPPSSQEGVSPGGRDHGVGATETFCGERAGSETIHRVRPDPTSHAGVSHVMPSGAAPNWLPEWNSVVPLAADLLPKRPEPGAGSRESREAVSVACRSPWGWPLARVPATTRCAREAVTQNPETGATQPKGTCDAAGGAGSAAWPLAASLLLTAGGLGLPVDEVHSLDQTTGDGPVRGAAPPSYQESEAGPAPRGAGPEPFFRTASRPITGASGATAGGQ